MNQINSSYATESIESLTSDKQLVFDIEAAKLVANFFKQNCNTTSVGEQVDESAEVDSKQPIVNADHKDKKDGHICCGKCKNCSCRK
ncbi:MAG: hypothetical protein OCC45_04600 [Desulfotalea sp.]